MPGTYRHIFYIPKYGRGNPSLAFVGLLKMVPWTVLELQGSLIASVFAGRANTPSRRDMEKWEQTPSTPGGSNAKLIKVLKGCSML